MVGAIAPGKFGLYNQTLMNVPFVLSIKAGTYYNL